MNDVIHVDFRARKVISPKTKETPDFLTPATWVFGSSYEATRHVPVKELAKVVRAYVRETYQLMKFSVRSDHNSIEIVLKDAGSVRVYNAEGRYSESMREIINDIEGFANTFNFDASDTMQDKFHQKFYVNVRT